MTFHHICQLSHTNSLLKLANMPDRSVTTNTDLTGAYCLPAVKDYKLAVNSCHKYTETNTEGDIVSIGSGLFKKGANLIKLQAGRVQVDFSVVFKSNTGSTVDEADISVEVAPVQEVVTSFKLTSKAPGEMVFTARAWFQPNQRLTFIARSVI